jgi:hypothetical protein
MPPVPETTQRQWRKSSHSGNGSSCVEVAAYTSNQIAVRDSKNVKSGAIAMPSTAWRKLIGCIKAGALDL